MRIEPIPPSLTSHYTAFESSSLAKHNLTRYNKKHKNVLKDRNGPMRHQKVMKQGTGSGFNTKLYTIAASYTATKSTTMTNVFCAFRGGSNSV